jgi:hypothetical protein
LAVFFFFILLDPNPIVEDVSMVPDDLLQLLEVLKYSLEEAWFGFVSDEIEHVIEESIGPRSRLLALRNCPQARSGYANSGKFNL